MGFRKGTLLILSSVILLLASTLLSAAPGMIWESDPGKVSARISEHGTDAPSDSFSSSFSSDKVQEPSSRADTTLNSGQDVSISTSFGASGNENLNIGGDGDLTISYNAPDGNNHFFPFRTLIKFDVSGIASNAEIVSAQLKLNYYKAVDLNGNEGTIDTTLTIKAHRVTHSWVEGTGTWSSATDDGATWNNYDGTNAWGTPGGDYVGSSTISATMPSSYGWVTWDVKSMVEGWITGTNENHGLILISPTEPNQPTLKYFKSFNAGSDSPKLEITYSTNDIPVAIIDSIDPSPARELTEITFTGYGTDTEDGDATSGFRWTAKSGANPTIVLGTTATVTADNLTAGTYTIGFSVQDSEGDWSYEETQALTVPPDEPPADIEDLKAEPHGSIDGAINLTWTAVAEDGEDEQGEAASYIIKYSDGMINSEASFENAKDPANKKDIPDPGEPEEEDGYTVLGLTSGEEYYFGIIAVDENGQQGGLSNIARAYAPDHTRPESITDLEAKQGENDGEVELEWTSPGEDGNMGKTTSYRIRYSEEEMENMWDFEEEAADIPNDEKIPQPGFPGESQSLTVTDLTGGKTYYFAIVALDESGNKGLLSNVETVVATDKVPPLYIQAVLVKDTPDDYGQSLDVTWLASQEADFHHYNIYISASYFSDVVRLTPEKSVNDIAVTSTTITTIGNMPIGDWNGYYVAVTAVDKYDNENPEIECFGPVRSINNIERPQPFVDPAGGETLTMETLIPNEFAEVEFSEITAQFEFEELITNRYRITYAYSVEGEASVMGDNIDHIDLYVGMKYKSNNWYWMPFLDYDEADDFEDIEDWEGEDIDDYYAIFDRPDFAGGAFSIVNHERSLDGTLSEMNGSFEEMMLEGKPVEFRLCAVAWTKTFKWNYVSQEFDPELKYQWKVDSDGDGLMDGWEKMHFGGIEAYDAKSDPDGDGYTNRLEYEKDTNPNDEIDIPLNTKKDVVSDKGGLGVGWWLIIILIVILFIGTVLIIVLVVVKRSKKKEDDAPRSIPAQGPSGPPAGPAYSPGPSRMGPPGPPPRGPPGPPPRGPPGRPPQGPSGPPPRGPPAGPPAAVSHPPQKDPGDALAQVQQEYQTILQKALAIRTQFTGEKDPQRKKQLESEYNELQKQVAALQQKEQAMRSGQTAPQQEADKPKQLPGTKEAQLALPAAQEAGAQQPQQAAQQKTDQDQGAVAAGGGDAALNESSPLDDIFNLGKDDKAGAAEPQPQTAAEAPAAAAGPTVVECHSCGAQNTVTTSERPTVVVCSVCSERGYLSE